MLNRLLNQLLNPYLLLIFSVISIILSIVDESMLFEGLVILCFAIVMILIVLRGARSQHLIFTGRILTAVLVLILVSVVWDMLYLWGNLPIALKYTFFAGAALIRLGVFGYGWLLLAKSLATRQKVTDRTIITAIVGYLFIGIIWSFVYFAIWQLDPQAFHVSILRDDQFKPWNLIMYFSFMTLTTVGYGDILPINKWAMALANFEAMIGAIYLTVIVARLVSLYSASEQN